MESRLHRTSLDQTKQPLVAIALLLIAGVILQNQLQLSPSFLLSSVIPFGITWMVVSWKLFSPPWPIAPLTLATGMWITLHALTTLHSTDPAHLTRQCPLLPCHVIVRGIVQGDPTFRKSESKSFSTKIQPIRSLTCEFELAVTALEHNSTWQPATGMALTRIKLNHSPSPSERITFGQILELEGVLDQPQRPRNFDLFDYAEYLRQQGIHHTLRIEKPQDARVIGQSGSWAWIFNMRRTMAERLTLGIENDPLACGIIRGMLLGYREDIPSDVNDAFRRTGTLHVFAISGSHITCIALAFLLILKQLRVPARWVGVIVLPILAFYVAATGLRASAIRSLIMATVVIAGWTLERPSALLNNLSAAALIILAWDPLQLYDTGFQLSFVVVTALILLAPALDRTLQSWTEPDPFIPRICLPAWRLSIQPLLRWTVSLIAVTLAAWIGSFGLTMYDFHLISPVSLPANLVVVPLASLSVGLGLVSLGLGAAWDHLAILLNTSHALIIHMMVAVTERLAALRQGFFYVPQPPMAWIIAGYALLSAIFLLWVHGRQGRALTLAALSLGLVLVPVIRHSLSRELRMDVLDVGNGQAILLSGPGFHRILMDAGSEHHAASIVEPFLHTRGVNALDLVILTHGDTLHYGGVRKLLPNLPIQRVAVADARFRSKPYRALLDTFRKEHIPVEAWHSGDTRELPCGRIVVIWPPSGKTSLARADDLGLVFSLRTDFGRLLFAADVGKTIEKRLASSTFGSCDILIQGMHDHEDSFTEPWLQTTKPRTLVSLGNEPPSSDLKSRWESCGAQILHTDQTGGIIFRLGEKGMTTESFLSWRAGTINP